MHGIGAVLADEDTPTSPTSRSSLVRPTMELQDLSAQNDTRAGLGPRKATLLYGNEVRKYEMAGELRMSSGARIDFVMVHRVNIDDARQKKIEDEAHIKLRERKDEEELEHDVSRAMKRFAFELALHEKGVDMEQEFGRDKSLVFTKMHMPFDLLLEMAEIMNMNLGLSDDEQLERKGAISVTEHIKGFASVLYKRFMDRFDIFDCGEEEEVDYFSAPFRRDRIAKFRFSNDQTKFFSDAQRATLTFKILSSMRYGNKSDQVGIRKLLHNGSFIAAYPLHDGPLPLRDDPTLPENQTCRGRLYQKWGRLRRFYKRQPISLIRNYFGETVGFYFAWLGFYTNWLFAPAFVGFIVFLYGLGSFMDQSDAKELCNPVDRVEMCPVCVSCKVWFLDEVCTPYRFSWVFDNPATIFFAIFMSIWASVFQDFWRRRNAKLAYEWDVRNLTLEEPDRPQFKALGKNRINPITGKDEKNYPKQLRFMKYGLTFSTVALTIAVVIMVAIGIILYRLAVSVSLFQSDNPSVKAQSAVIASATAAVINLVAITILSKIYRALAVKMTNWENHRKDSKYESHLVFKIYMFEFVNTYASLVYIAFFKGQFNGYPGNYNLFFGLRPDQCPQYGCLLELTIQLSIIMVGKQIFSGITEFVLPRLSRWWRKRQAKKHPSSSKGAPLPWEVEFALEPWPEHNMFYEYLEMIIQFGFITLFVASFPLSPLFALLNNIFEIRVDADKMITGLRRPPAFTAANIGIWESVLEFVSFFSVITNGLVIAITSSYLTKLVYKYAYNWDMVGFINITHPFFPEANCSYTTLLEGDGTKGLFFYQVWACRLAFLILFEHVVFILKTVAQALIPNVPKSIDLKIRREDYLGSQALQDAWDIDKMPDVTDDPHIKTVHTHTPSVASLA